MFDLGWTELLVIGIVALIVVGPRDLPGMFRTVGRFVGKARGMAREFSRAMNDAADQSGVSDLQKTLKAASDPMKTAMNEVRKTTGDVARDLDRAASLPRDPEGPTATTESGARAAPPASAKDHTPAPGAGDKP